MNDKPEVLTDDQIHAALADLPDWRISDGALQAAYQAASADAAAELAHGIGLLAEALDDRPRVDQRDDTVFIRTSTQSMDRQITDHDVELAGRVSVLAQAAQAHPELVPATENGA
jgi:4a-hydroxytetrahydrobiopterin dehydratase